jgi:hypothetical protein
VSSAFRFVQPLAALFPVGTYAAIKKTPRVVSPKLSCMSGGHLDPLLEYKQADRPADAAETVSVGDISHLPSIGELGITLTRLPEPAPDPDAEPDFLASLD